MNWKRLIIVSVLSCMLVGCIFKKQPSIPPKVQWGKAGEQPTAVWKDYDWIIRALEE